MAKVPALQIVTANRLRDGAVVYLGPDTLWSVRIADAVPAADEASAKALLAVAARDVEAAQVVAPYAIEVERRAGGLMATSFRERIRAEGPSLPVLAGLSALQDARHVSL